MIERASNLPPSYAWPRRDLEDARERHFAATMDLVCGRHPFYREVMAQHDLARADFGAVADLAKLPVTTKQDLMARADDFVLERDGLDEDIRTVWDVMYTTGSTSGTPTPFVSTSYDFFNILMLNRNMMLIRGVGESDIVANLFPLTRQPHGAFIRALQAPAVMNIPVVAALPGNPSADFTLGNSTEETVRIVERSRATVLWGVPSFIRRLLQTAQTMGANFSAVHRVFVTGEALYPEARRDLVERLVDLGATDPVISGSYGMTEMQGGAVECPTGTGFHNPLPDQFLIEIVDPESHRPVTDGTEGLVLLTHLNRRGTVLLRYAVGDISALTRETCPGCGATTERLTLAPRRADALVKIKGMLVNPEPVLARLSGDMAIAAFRLTVEHADPADPLSRDVLRLRVAPADDGDAALPERLSGLVKAETGITPKVEVVEVEAFDAGAPGWKAKPFADLRQQP
ncbi:MAG TPA: AMP-binding protein [Alphaproteobacteria bacterium]|nr:AMP-binding protein [Alphaproteobacteria bacterium]